MKQRAMQLVTYHFITTTSIKGRGQNLRIQIVKKKKFTHRP